MTVDGPGRRGLPLPAATLAAALLCSAAAPAFGVAAERAPIRPAVGLPASALSATDLPSADDAETASAQPRLQVEAISPAVPRRAGRLTLRGELTNPGDGPLVRAQVALQVSRAPLTSRSQLSAVANGSDPGLSLRTVRPAQTTLAAAIRPGAAGGWRISVPMKALALDRNGVYVLRLRATARARPGTQPREVATVQTFLPFLPDQDQYSPTRVSWLWPLAGEPARDPHGAFLGPSPGDAFAPGSRLADLLAAPAGTPVTWILDPEVADSAQALSGEHQRVGTAGAVAADPDQRAQRWLADLASTLKGQPVAALPYADPDVAALAHHDQRAALRRAVARSRAVTAAVLGRESDTTVAWPADGAADERALAALRSAGARTVVLSSAALQLQDPPTYTPTGRATVRAGADARDTLEVLVADEGLHAALEADLGDPGAPALSAQRFLSDLALITLERPNQARTMLIAPPRRWDPPPGWSAQLLRTTATAPWVRTIGLSSLSQLPAAAEYAEAELSYPAAAADHELTAAQIQRLGTGFALADDLIRLLARPESAAGAYTGALLGAVSTTWRHDPQGGRERLLSVLSTLEADVDSVRVIGRSLVTLSSTTGTIPLTISNELAQAIRVRPVLRPRVASRMSVTVPDLLTIGAGRKATVRVQAEAAANGITQLEVQLLDAAGEPFGPTSQLRVNVTSFGKVGMFVIVAAGGVLFGTAIWRNVRRLRRPGPAEDPVTP